MSRSGSLRHHERGWKNLTGSPPHLALRVKQEPATPSLLIKMLPRPSYAVVEVALERTVLGDPIASDRVSFRDTELPTSAKTLPSKKDLM